jgi:hypothetical protein
LLPVARVLAECCIAADGVAPESFSRSRYYPLYAWLGAVTQPDNVNYPSRLRYGIVALARSDRRMMEATLASIARLADGPEAMVLAVPKLRAHLFGDVTSAPRAPSG